MKRIAIFLTLTSLLYLAAFLKSGNALTLTRVESAGKAFMTQNKKERFQLWNGCLPVRLYVSVIGYPAPHTVSPNLHPKVEAVARSKLQDAELYDPSSVNLVSPALYLILSWSRVDEFKIYTTYRKRLTDNATNESGYIIAWDLSGSDPVFGISRKHHTDPEYILHWVSKHTDRFIEEYRRVNADACTHR